MGRKVGMPIGKQMLPRPIPKKGSNFVKSIPVKALGYTGRVDAH